MTQFLSCNDDRCWWWKSLFAQISISMISLDHVLMCSLKDDLEIKSDFTKMKMKIYRTRSTSNWCKFSKIARHFEALTNSLVNLCRILFIRNCNEARKSPMTSTMMNYCPSFVSETVLCASKFGWILKLVLNEQFELQQGILNDLQSASVNVKVVCLILNVILRWITSKKEGGRT